MVQDTFKVALGNRVCAFVTDLWTKAAKALEHVSEMSFRKRVSTSPPLENTQKAGMLTPYFNGLRMIFFDFECATSTG